VAVAQEPIERDQRVGAVDLSGIEHRLDLGNGLDEDADVLLLGRKPVDPAGAAAIDSAAIEPDRLVEAAGCRHHGLDRQERAYGIEIGLLARLTASDLLR